ncbi:MAG: glycosyltransferase [Bacteroidota bacterium]
MQDRISILILTYNRPADLLELLQNLNSQSNIKDVLEEILILNNASTEPYTDVTDYITNNPILKAKYIWSDVNLGVAKGRNTLLKLAKGNILLSIDDDMAFTKPTDLQQLASLFNQPFFKESNTGIITFRVIYYENKEVQLTAFPHKKYEKYSSKQQFLTYYFAGGAHIMKRELVEANILYPTDFHYGMEEYELSYCALNLSYTIGYDNSVTVMHKESPLGRQTNYKKLQMQWVNKSKVAWRHLPLKYFITTAGAWAIEYLRKSNGHYATFFLTIWQIIRIPFTEKRNTVSKETLKYLHNVEARLNY